MEGEKGIKVKGRMRGKRRKKAKEERSCPTPT
jgi:hypothetical protein